MHTKILLNYIEMNQLKNSLRQSFESDSTRQVFMNLKPAKSILLANRNDP